MENPLKPNEFIKFNLNLFMKELREYEKYFKEEVKIADTILLNDVKDCFEFEIISKNMDIIVKFTTYYDNSFEPPKLTFQLNLLTPDFIIYNQEITREQYLKIDKICHNIYNDYSSRKITGNIL